MKKDKQMIYARIEFGLDRDDPFIPASYITFRREHAQEIGRVTKIWTVYEGVNHRGADLGQVRWFGRWRKYSFFPAPDMVFEETCLLEIAHFCSVATNFHKQKRTKAAAA